MIWGTNHAMNMFFKKIYKFFLLLTFVFAEKEEKKKEEKKPESEDEDMGFGLFDDE